MSGFLFPILFMIFVHPLAEASQDWTPFFEPKVKVDQMLRDLERGNGRLQEVTVTLGRGLEAFVYARARREQGEVKVVSVKQYSHFYDAEDGFEALKKMKGLAERGVFGELKIAEVYSRSGSEMELQLIEGISLYNLIISTPSDPRVSKLYVRWKRMLTEIAQELQRLGYRIEKTSWDSSKICEQILSSSADPAAGVFDLGGFMVFGKGSAEFGIHSTNIIVEAKTGIFYLVDGY
jgi:hypothetical protein